MSYIGKALATPASMLPAQVGEGWGGWISVVEGWVSEGGWVRGG